MHLPKFDMIDWERAELRYARDADDNVFAARDPKRHASDPGADGGAATLFSLVFVTAEPQPTQGSGGDDGSGGGGGNDGGGATMGAPAEQTNPPAETPTVHEPVPVQTTFQTQEQPTPTPTPTPHTSPKTSQEPKHAATHTSAAAVTTEAVPTTIPSVAGGAASTASPSSAPQAQQQQQGLSSGAKAGIAIGVLIGVGLLAALAVFAIRMWKKNKDEAEDEKHNPFSDSAAPPPSPPKVQRGYTPPPVPPMTDFARPSTAGTQTNPFASPSANASTRDLNAPLPPPVNPFGNQAALVSQSSFNGSIPIGDETHNMTPPTPVSAESEKAPIGAALGGAAAGAAVGAAAAGALSSQNRNNAPKALELDATRPAPPFANQGVPQSPAASAYSFTSQSGAVAAAAVAGAPPPPVSNVHRVQLDFAPSMHDEMELKQGELVRMLHEYDDGWALCTKFDKSARGVCPRTCLSQKPLQPRGRNGPPPPRTPAGPGGPGPRGPPPVRTASPAPSNRGLPRPQGPPSRSASPAPAPALGPGAPAGVHPNMQNWPAKPTNASTITPNLSNWPAQPVNAIQRSMSPGPYGGGPQQQQARPNGPAKRRSQSVGGGINMPKPLSVNSDEFALPIQGTPTQSPVSRKPVPSS